MTGGNSTELLSLSWTLSSWLERICEARNALLDQIADLSKPINREEYTLRSALETLRILQELAERDLNEQEKSPSEWTPRAREIKQPPLG